MVQIHSGSVCITGQFRENNEDNCLIDPQDRYFLVADGMGGQSAGEKASALAIELVPQRLEQLIDFQNSTPEQVTASIDKAVSYANSEIMALSEVDPAYHNMGTTLVYLVQVGGLFYVGGVGDSRVYLLRNGRFDQLTTDHSLTQALVDAGTLSQEDAANHRFRNVLYRYLGTKEGSSGTEPQQITPQPGDRFLLCTDGVTDGLEIATLEKVLKEAEDPQKAAESIVAAAEEGGSKDNITCLVVAVD